MKRFSLPKLLAGLILAAAAIFAVYRLEFRPVPVAAHTLATGEVRGEVMGTGTLIRITRRRLARKSFKAGSCKCWRTKMTL